MESDKRIKIEGEGYLINKDSNKRFPVRFEIEQIHTGKISGKCMLSGFEYEDILNPSQLKNCRCISGGLIKISVYEMQEYILENFRNSPLKGETNNRGNVTIEEVFIYSCGIKDSKSEMTLDLKFSASEVEVSYETISTKDQLGIKYGIINLDLTLLLRERHIETDIGKITFSKLKDHEEVIEEMKIFKTPLLSGFLNITDVNIGNFESFDSYLKTVVDTTIGKVLELLSLAQSTYLSHCLICIYAKTPNSNSQDDYKLKKLIMRDIKTRAPSLGQPLIRDWADIYKFISPKTIQKYSDLRKKCDLNIAFEWYLESLSHGVLQSDYLLACTCLELLKDRHNKEKGNEYIIRPNELFEEEYYPSLKEKTREVLKETFMTHRDTHEHENNKVFSYQKGINKGTEERKRIRAEIYANLKGINRTSFKNSLLLLLNDLHIIYNDLFLDSFSWDNVPENDSEKQKLISFLRDGLDIDWAENAEIRKHDDGKTIRISKDENSAEIMIDEKEVKATLKISDGRTHDIEVKKENGKLNVYPFPNIKAIPEIRNQITHRGIQEIRCLFSFYEIVDDKKQQEKLFKHLQIIDTQLSQLIENAGYSLDGNERIRVTTDENKIATLEIENDFCYFKRENEKDIKIGVVRHEDDKLNIYEISTEELSDVYERLICLIQRIFLALMGYDGYFLDRNDRYKRKKFTDFISGDFARTAEEIS